MISKETFVIRSLLGFSEFDMLPAPTVIERHRSILWAQASDIEEWGMEVTWWEALW